MHVLQGVKLTLNATCYDVCWQAVYLCLTPLPGHHWFVNPALVSSLRFIVLHLYQCSAHFLLCNNAMGPKQRSNCCTCRSGFLSRPASSAALSLRILILHPLFILLIPLCLLRICHILNASARIRTTGCSDSPLDWDVSCFCVRGLAVLFCLAGDVPAGAGVVVCCLGVGLGAWWAAVRRRGCGEG